MTIIPDANDSAQVRETDASRRPLEEKYYSLTPEEVAFFQSYTGIQDEEELKKHILKVQSDAYAVYPYGCIRYFGFTKLSISRLPAYKDLLQLGRERQGALFLDLGCCFGNAVRKAVVDGFPAQQAIASDLHPEFWEMGHQLFRDDKEGFPATFLPGDIFDTNFLADSLGDAHPTADIPPLQGLSSLTPLLGRLSAIHASMFFHLFDEERQAHLARKLASLLTPEPGSMLFGAHIGLPEKGFCLSVVNRRTMFCHSPESWKELWEKEIFKEGEVRAETKLREIEIPGLTDNSDMKWHVLIWSVTRV